MSVASRLGDEPLPLDLALRIEEIYSGFESAWSAGRRPQIEDFLAELPEGPGRPALLAELLALDLRQRRRAGETPTLEEYQQRFPKNAALVDKVFREEATEKAGARPRVCNRFEAAWKAGQHPRIEDYLGDAPEPERTALLRELVALDLDYRGRAGDRPAAVDYRARFPEIDTVWLAGMLATRAASGQEVAGVPPCLGDFEIIREIGRGGMGIVYEARQVSLNRRVALKTLSGALALTPTGEARFHREAEAAAKLHHTNIVSVYTTGEAPGIHYYAMELVEGPSLDKVIHQLRQGHSASPAPGSGSGQGSSSLGSDRHYFDTVARMIADVADALDHAHKHGIIHRDIKPSNLLLSPDGRLSVNDFGLARVLEQPGMTVTGEFVGTPTYMSPEQVTAGRVPLDHRTDVYSLGATLYELLTLQPPFTGERRDQVLAQILHKEPRPPRRLNKKVPLDLETICLKALEKDPDRRYRTAGDMAEDLRRYVNRFAIRARRAGPLTKLAKFSRRHKAGVAATALLVLLVAVAALFGFKWASAYARSKQVEWARKEAILAIQRMIDEKKYRAALDLAEEAEQYIPNDPTLRELVEKSSIHWYIETDPPNAEVYVKRYGTDEDWRRLGPALYQRLPRGLLHWKVTKEGYNPVEGFRNLPRARFTLDRRESVPPGMVRVMGNYYLQPLGPVNTGRVLLEDYFMDQYEVTNRQFKDFVDGGGYRNTQYWKHKFIKGEAELSWEAAIKDFCDQTGKPGPAVWRSGTYPAGEDDHPVRGISWYEAAAYAEFAGKSLPTVVHWVRASGILHAADVIRLSNFAGSGPAPVGSYQGMGPFGTYDMAGNVREWCWNEAGGNRRYILGGSWDEPDYMFYYPDARTPFDRSPTNGFRCVKYLAAPPRGALGEFVLQRRDYSKETPVSDEVFNSLRDNVFAYDKTPLNDKHEAREEFLDYIHEKITFDAAYGNERVIVHLYLPRGVEPPYQTVVFFPNTSSRVQASYEQANPSGNLPKLFDFLVRSGRAVLWPIYNGTFERNAGVEQVDFQGEITDRIRDLLVQIVKDFGRSIDYLEKRPDIDPEKLAYYGRSWGGCMGTYLLPLEKRIKAAVLRHGGFVSQKPRYQELDPVNFAPRVTTPVLMLNGEHDWIFPVETCQRPMFKALGSKYKRWEVYPNTGHGVPDDEARKKTLAWFDEHLGSVQPRKK